MTGYDKYFFIFSFIVFNALLFARETDTTVVIDEVVISAGKIPFSLSDVPRSVSVINAEGLKNSPAQNIQDLLANIQGVDVKKRGPEGVQADISVRGGTFEQTLILLDGIKLSDPQTGHHSLNIPINYDDVERIEILKGQASSLYGPNALAGAVNIISKKGASPKLNLNISGGANGFYKGAVSLHSPVAGFNNLFSFSKTKSDGYRHNTSFDILTAYASSSYRFISGDAVLSAGYTGKKFGANGFYSDKYPDQWEETKTFLASSALNYAFGSFSLSPKIFWRNNNDYYLLDYSRPEFYKNTHETNSFGAELQSVYSTGIGSFALGGEIITDNIVSSNLGSHNRQKGGVSAEIAASPLSGLNIVLGGFAYYYDTFGMKLWPGIDIGYRLSDEISVYASAGKSFRIPTFTELYYSSPAQIGNASLRPEECATYETGINYYSRIVVLNFGGFYRKGDNLIDWARESSDKPWIAENIAVINTKGIDVSLSFFPDYLFDFEFIKKIKIGYSYLQSDIQKSPRQSRYILDHLKHQIVSEITHDLPFNTGMSWVFRYAARFNQEDYFIADAKLTLPVYKMNLLIEADNLFNRSYLDIGGIPMPGRWIKAGLSLSFPGSNK